MNYSRRKCLAKSLLNKAELATLFKLSKAKANKLFIECEKLDNDYPYRIDDQKVHLSTACDVMNVTTKQLLIQISIEEQIELEQEKEKQCQI